MRCPDCDHDLTGLTVANDGNIECPECGKRAVLESIAGTQTHHAGRPLVLPLSERFEYLERVGEGSFGIVFKAYDKELQRFVAIKTPKSVEGFRVDMFLREARAASRLRHPNIVSVFDVQESGKSVHIVSEYVDGTSLRAWIERKSPGVVECCRVVIAICEAVSYAHQEGIVHRDIKPANIVMDSEGNPHLLDFGLSQSRIQSLDTIGVHGQPIGTPAFMAPEQVRGDMESIDKGTDVYAIGIVLYQMLTKSLPFHGNSSQLYKQILEVDPPSLRKAKPDLPRSLDAICLKSLAKKIADRYDSADAMGEDLRRFVEGRVVKAYGHWDRRSIGGMTRRHAAKGAIGLLGAAFAATAWNVGRRKTTEIKSVRTEVQISPVGCSVVWEPLSSETGLPDSTRSMDWNGKKSEWMEPGYYRVLLTNSTDRFYVYRTIPELGAEPVVINFDKYAHRWWTTKKQTVILEPIHMQPLTDVQSNMVFQAGGSISPTGATSLFKNKTFLVRPYLIDAREVSQEEFERVLPNFYKGVPLVNRNDKGGPMLQVPFDMAIAYAEKVGKQVQTVWQWLWSATNGGKTRFPWGESTEPMAWKIKREEDDLEPDKNQSTPPVWKLYSGALEWADTPSAPLPAKYTAVQMPANFNPMLQRAIVGGPFGAHLSLENKTLSMDCNPAQFEFASTTQAFPYAGFRCVREVV